MRLAAVVFGLLTSCASAYTHGTLLVDPETGARAPNARAYHCVDIALRPEWFAEGPPGGQMIGVEIGNPCDVSVETDFREMRVQLGRAHTLSAAGATPTLVPASAWDPRHELRRAHVPPHGRVMERIVYIDETLAGDAPIVRACVSLRGVVPGAEAEPDVCFARRPFQDEEGAQSLSSWVMEQ